MDYFNIRSFELGILLFLCPYITNIIYIILCRVYKIKIAEFTIFYNPWFTIYSENISGTKLNLGWLPIGALIKPFGMGTNESENKDFSNGEIPYVFNNKPKFFKIIFKLVPVVLYIILFSLSFLWIFDFTNISENFKNYIEYIINAFYTMFNLNIKEQFLINTKELLANKSIVIFGFSICIFLGIIIMPFSMLYDYFTYEKKSKSKLNKILEFLFTIGISWLIMWKIPSFIFSFFPLINNLICIGSLVIGVMICGIVLFMASLIFARKTLQTTSSNNNDLSI